MHAPLDDFSAHFSGLERCGSIWACPVCSAVIRAARACEITSALDAADALGYGIGFLTLTLRHSVDDPLSLNLDHLLKAWRSVTSWRSWKALAARFGWIGSIRSVEVTYGANGWHPHAHLAMVFASPLTDAQRLQFEQELAPLWIKAVGKVGGSLPSLGHGTDFQLSDGSGKTLAAYLSKVQEDQGNQRTKIGQELARGDMKRGRAGSLNPFELLDDSSGSTLTRRLWAEYVEATRGRRAFAWSKGLRRLLLPQLVEQTDEELLDDAERGDLIGWISADDYDTVYRDSPQLLHALLCASEQFGSLEILTG